MSIWFCCVRHCFHSPLKCETFDWPLNKRQAIKSKCECKWLLDEYSHIYSLTHSLTSISNRFRYEAVCVELQRPIIYLHSLVVLYFRAVSNKTSRNENAEEKNEKYERVLYSLIANIAVKPRYSIRTELLLWGREKENAKCM